MGECRHAPRPLTRGVKIWCGRHTLCLRSQVRKPLTLDPARSRQRSPLWWLRTGVTGRSPISSRQDQRLSAFKSSLLPRDRVHKLK